MQMAMASIATLAVGAAFSSPFVNAFTKRNKSRFQSCPCAPLMQCNGVTENSPSHLYHLVQQSSAPKKFSAECEKIPAPAEKDVSFKLSAAVLPMMAAVLVGSGQPAVATPEWEKLYNSVDETDTKTDTGTYSPYAGDDAYKDLVQRMKEKKAKRTRTGPLEEKSDAGSPTFTSPFSSPPVAQTAPTEENSYKESSPFSFFSFPGVKNIFPTEKNSSKPSPPFPFFSPPVAQRTAPIQEKPEGGSVSPNFSSPGVKTTAPTEKYSDKGASQFSFSSPPAVQNTAPTEESSGSFPFSFFSPPVGQKSPAVADTQVAKPILEKAAQVVPAVQVEIQKTHGFLPLFVTQLLLLVATVGGGFSLLTTPQSKWDELQKRVDGYVEKASPVVEDAWAKAQPVVVQAQKNVHEFAKAAKPIVGKAWEAAKPLAAKAVQASKPIVKQAQAKAMELFQQGKS